MERLLVKYSIAIQLISGQMPERERAGQITEFIAFLAKFDTSFLKALIMLEQRNLEALEM